MVVVIRLRKALGLALLFLPTAALAHPGVFGSGSGFVGGLLHPLGGPDHVLAMLAMGLWSAQLGGRAQWLLPLLFLAAMAAGAGAGMLAVSAAPAAPLEIALLGSHGLEVPDPGHTLGYGAGFLTATATLQGAGVALGVALSRVRALLRVGGAALVAAGLAAGWLGLVG